MPEQKLDAKQTEKKSKRDSLDRQLQDAQRYRFSDRDRLAHALQQLRGAQAWTSQFASAVADRERALTQLRHTIATLRSNRDLFVIDQAALRARFLTRASGTSSPAA